MGRQTKVTESYPVKKSTATPKLAVKRKLLISSEETSKIDDDDESGQENHNKVFISSVPSLESINNFQAAKNVLHTARPTTLIAREEEIKTIYEWLDERLESHSPGSMYISGAPGTGKTATVLHCIQTWMSCHPSRGTGGAWHHVINCMNILSASQVYSEIGAKIALPKKYDATKENVEAKLFSGKKMIVLVLDEMDQLLGPNSKGTDLLYTLFSWTNIPESRLILIGIANALDLTLRHLPLLQSNNSPGGNGGVVRSPSCRSSAKSKPKTTTGRRTSSSLSTEIRRLDPMKVINFAPYERQDIEKILEARLLEIGSNVFEPGAVKFVAAKVAATTGDVRKALNACKLALDAVEKNQRETLKSTADDGFNFSSPKKFCSIREKINVGMVSKVFVAPKDEGPLPLQQMIILTTLLRLHKLAPQSQNPKVDGISAPFPMNTMYNEYRAICATKGFSWIERSDIVSICGMLQDRSLVTVVENMGGKNNSKRGAGTMSNVSKSGFSFNYNSVDKIVMQSDMKSIILDM